jgi:hypothetical protein
LRVFAFNPLPFPFSSPILPSTIFLYFPVINFDFSF